MPGTPKKNRLLWLFQLDDEPNLYLGNGSFTKHPFIHGCLEFQVYIISLYILYIFLYAYVCLKMKACKRESNFLFFDFFWHSVKI